MHILTTPHINADGTINGAVLIRKYKIARQMYSQLHDECAKYGISVGDKYQISNIDVEEKICELFNLTIEQLRSKSRRRHLVEARAIAFYMMYNYCDMTLVQIGLRFGNRDHTTVLHNLRSYEDWMITCDSFIDKVNRANDAILKKPVKHD